jgi:Helix-turn-helix domain
VGAILAATLYQLIRQGRIKTVKIGARIFIRGAELELFLDQQQAAWGRITVETNATTTRAGGVL